MSIVYKCRHCGHIIGEIEQTVLDSAALGWDQLTAEEKKDMIHYLNNGDVHIQSICESCEESLSRYPEYHELDFFIQ